MGFGWWGLNGRVQGVVLALQEDFHGAMHALTKALRHLLAGTSALPRHLRPTPVTRNHFSSSNSLLLGLHVICVIGVICHTPLNLVRPTRQRVRDRRDSFTPLPVQKPNDGSWNTNVGASALTKPHPVSPQPWSQRSAAQGVSMKLHGC